MFESSNNFKQRSSYIKGSCGVKKKSMTMYDIREHTCNDC